LISLFDLAALLLTLSALFGWLNHRLVRLPHTIGLLVMGLAASLLLVLLDLMFPGQHLYAQLKEPLLQIDFTQVMMNGMLAFLLFAGAIHLDVSALRDRAWPVAFLALVGTIMSTAIVGVAFFGAGAWLCFAARLGLSLRSADQPDRSGCGVGHAQKRECAASARGRDAGRGTVQ
jgi:monovalent cation:H+ antiporter, CPA1 family